jgi:hypothetical protein
MKYYLKLFLNNIEREELLVLHDTLMNIEVESEEQLDQRDRWLNIISKLIFGKSGHFPVTIDGTEEEE